MEKKSLLNNLRSAKKANVIKAGPKNEGTSTRKVRLRRAKMMQGSGGGGGH